MPRLDAVTRLERRGIVAWRIEGALARLTAAQSKADPLAKEVSREIVAAGAEVAVKIRKRVVERGDLGRQKAPPYSRKWRSASRAEQPDYVRIAGAPAEALHAWRTINGIPEQVKRPWYLASADFHRAAQVRDGSYHVTGGMWAGLQARGTGKAGVILDFQGSSLGSKDKNIRNAQKAYAIFREHKVHVLRLKDRELQAMGMRVANRAGRWVELRLKGE